MKNSTTRAQPPSSSTSSEDEKMPLMKNETRKPIQTSSKIKEHKGETRHRQQQTSCAWWCRHRRGKIRKKGWNTKRLGAGIGVNANIRAGDSSSGSLRMEICQCQKSILGFKCNGVLISSADSIKLLLQTDPSQINTIDEFGNNLLHLAFLCASRNSNGASAHAPVTVEHIMFLLEQRPNLALSRNRDRYLPLHCAIDCLFNNENAFGSREAAQEIIEALCSVNARMIFVKVTRGDNENCNGSDDALDLAHDARSRKPSMEWLYSQLLEIKVKLHKTRKQMWEHKGFEKVFPSGESKSTPSSTSCCHSVIITEPGDWAIDTRGIYT